MVMVSLVVGVRLLRGCPALPTLLHRFDRGNELDTLDTQREPEFIRLGLGLSLFFYSII